MCWGFFKSYGWAASECCNGPDSTLVKNADETPSGNFSNLDDPPDTFRSPNSPDVLRAGPDHPQQTGTFVAKELSPSVPLRDQVKNLSPDERELIKSVETFKPNGVSNADAIRFIEETSEGQKLFESALKFAGPDAKVEEVLQRAVGFVETGVDLPVLKQMSSPLVKIVPEGSSVNKFSPFFTTKEQLELAQKSGRPLADFFGLPASSDAAKFSVFEIRPKGTATVFESVIAPTSELGGKLTTNGGARQIIVPDRSQFLDAELLKVIDDNL